MIENVHVVPSITLPALSLSQLQSVAGKLAPQIYKGDVITLSGEFGAGKTTFARAFIQAIAVDTPVVASPTFMLMQSYDIRSLTAENETLWHLDLCRLKHISEADSLGLRELWSHRVLIEWPEIIAPLLPQNHLNIAFDFTASDDIRSLTFYGNDTWRQRLERLNTLL